MAWFKRTPKDSRVDKKVKIPEGLWVKCNNCKEIIYKKEFERNLKVCPKCNYHFRISAGERLKLLSDNGSFKEMFSNIKTINPLDFADSMPYEERIRQNREKSGNDEAIICGEADVNKIKIVLCVLDFSFMGGSMGSVVGERLVRSVEHAMEKKTPLVIFSSSGGARMQEGILSLMQMAKTSAAIGKFKDDGGLYISILTDPTFGGVSASFAMLGDIIIAEPRSLIGFAGPRVIEQTIKQQLPGNFQKAEFLLEHGLIDMVVARKDIKETITRLLKLLK
ncbi:acetyl-coenzyme A carboxylase carboxyl transferase subunit beta [bacterium BMS3Abin07]|nr:acetyl-coenzyme A carboxylase carboxyl transferase subunit beta [bacterium BMS3Abin07]GBE31418.1 acetyl-coenzyme A carboxylase carboxyl transferase subunit beta [bacterium BMS3Bbin05]HDL21247.1 acetyl-CoA carboxylase carboxyltransferase subunit beta [Nitrospirota bacterium]HDO22189.1 acetyl-CoA carboxylase carboxyltransferase subunit beta [Nitrospirota bacterium]HDZ87341.1 acetyl-CoA carboxylase carboxyltransferase subunit beta [Nitrospirota bacterium]